MKWSSSYKTIKLHTRAYVISIIKLTNFWWNDSNNAKFIFENTPTTQSTQKENVRGFEVCYSLNYAYAPCQDFVQHYKHSL